MLINFCFTQSFNMPLCYKKIVSWKKYSCKFHSQYYLTFLLINILTYSLTNFLLLPLCYCTNIFFAFMLEKAFL